MLCIFSSVLQSGEFSFDNIQPLIAKGFNIEPQKVSFIYLLMYLFIFIFCYR